MEENKVKLSKLKEKYNKSQNLNDIFHWTYVAFLFAFVVYVLFFLLSYKNVSNTTLTINIILLSIIFLGFVVFFVLDLLKKKELKQIRIDGKNIDRHFNIMIEEFELRSIERNSRITKAISQTFIYVFLVFIAIIVLFPFYWMLNSSLKSLEEYKLSTPTFWPKNILFSNYKDAYNTANLGTLFLNTLYVGLVSTILSLIITVITAFAFARLEFKGKNTLFAALLATMMIPGELFTITNYATVSQLKWTGTYTVLIVPFLVSVFYIYLLRQNFLQIPNELYLAAKVDGTSDMKYLLKVMVPLSLPTLISITILKMMGAWNSYVWPNLVANDAAHRLITNGLRNSFTDSSGDVNYPIQMAAVALVSLPLFLVFIFLRKYIMKGVSRSGIKG
ncbi:MAG: carbohydrate ABC transporter permease [Erysipelotrichaceae bacterium]|nr:carbohydrate ABC transporter permease [Erysipelotrichaceae bacterium]